MLKINTYGTEYEAVLEIGNYSNNNNIYVGLYVYDEDGSLVPYCNITTNIEKMGSAFACIDTNNSPFIAEWLVDNDLGFFVGYDVKSGFCSYPVFLFDEMKLEELCKEEGEHGAFRIK